jgi:hypothetical protein
VSELLAVACKCPPYRLRRDISVGFGNLMVLGAVTRVGGAEQAEYLARRPPVRETDECRASRVGRRADLMTAAVVAALGTDLGTKRGAIAEIA